ncbi:MAG: ribonuclease [Actinomycetota bacterium]|jgi:ribonuclease E|nr:ribonuclease [Actinomycetota bacterium]
MLDNEPPGSDTGAQTTTHPAGEAAGGADSATRPRRRRAATRPAGPPSLPQDGEPAAAAQPTAALATGVPAPEASPATATKAPAKRTRKKTTAPAAAPPQAPAEEAPAEELPVGLPPAPEDAAEPTEAVAPVKKAAKRSRKKTAAPAAAPPETPQGAGSTAELPAPDAADDEVATGTDAAGATAQPPGVLFQAPEPTAAPARRRTAKATATPVDLPPDQGGDDRAEATAPEDVEAAGDGDDSGEDGTARRRRRGGRGRRGRGRGGEGAEEASSEASAADEAQEATAAAESESAEDDDETGPGGTRRRRRRRRRGGADDPEPGGDDPPNTVVRVREPRKSSRSRSDEDDSDGVRSVKGSTRLEAKKQRRREGREAGRRRPSVITEAEFLARRESVTRTMVVRQAAERTQIAVLEDGVLVEHYVNSATSSGLVGNVYLGKVQNVLPSMEAAFVDVGKGRNAVLYAGEVNWDAAGLEGQPKRIEQALKSGDSVLAQVTKDSIGQKGARLTSQISLAGRYLVLVPGASMTGISRKLPDTERSRLKSILKRVVPEGAGVIVRTAAEGASEDELARDVARLTAQWEDIEKKSAKASAPALLYSEPDLTIRVVRDVFNEDFSELVVSGDEAWDMLQPYVGHVAPDLAERLTRWTDEKDVFAAHRIDEQLAKALDRKVWLPSGGYLIIDRTEAMVVIDVNTGKFTGAGGNLEETVTKNNLEAAEEIVRQLRLRDLGGMIVVDFIDMVLESNRELVLRRLTECLGRDRTKHQVAEVTSLGLVQMTRKRVGQGLHEVFAETCEHCNGRGYHMRSEPVESRGGSVERKGGGKGRGKGDAAAGDGERPRPMLPAPKGKGAGVPGAARPSEVSASPVAAEDPVEPSPGPSAGSASEPPSEPPTEPSTTPAVVADARADANGDLGLEVAGAAAGPAPRGRRRRRATG